MVKHQKQLYASILLKIKQSLDLVGNDREEAFDQLKSILITLDDEHINIDELCRSSGDSQAYYHNKYLMSVFYLTLGECYDFTLGPGISNTNLAKKYYMLSDQPPAKWRIARLYLAKKIRYDGDVNVIAYRLIAEAIESLIGELHNQRYFGKRLDYLVDMYDDLHQLPLPIQEKEIHNVYFDIVQWIINNQQNIRSEHQDIIARLLTFDVSTQTPREDNLLVEISQLT